MAMSPSGPPPVLPSAQHIRHAKCWELLWGLPVSNNVKVFGVRLLHAALPCRALVAGMRPQPATYVACPACASRLPSRRDVPPETYTHLFLECPTSRPAVVWLLDLWLHLTGVRPPLTAEVIVAADMEAWPDGPTGPQLEAWHSLRLILLFQIWAARCEVGQAPRSPSTLVRATIAAVAAEIRLQFARSREREVLLRELPTHVLAIQHLRPAGDGLATWQSSGLCQVLGGGGGTSVGRQHLLVLLSDTSPVPLPPDP